MAQIPIPASDDFTREKEESKNGENMEMVVEGCGEMSRLRMKRRKAVMRGAGRKVEKRKNASLRENFDYNAGSSEETGRFADYLPGY